MGNDQFAADTENTVEDLRRALSLVDGPPAEVTELARIAFQFRGVETAEAVSAAPGVRSSSDGVTMQASKGGTTIVWTSGADGLSGVVHGPGAVRVYLQTTEEKVIAEVDPSDGSFTFPAPAGPRRLIIEGDDADWATPWIA